MIDNYPGDRAASLDLRTALDRVRRRFLRWQFVMIPRPCGVPPTLPEDQGLQEQD